MKNILKKILLIDDSDIDYFITQKMIERAGIAKEIVVMNSVQKALEYISKGIKEGTFPDSILLDINMPIQDGFNFLDKYSSYEKVLRDKCKVIVLSSSDKEEDLMRIGKNPMVVDYLVKPLSAVSMERLKEKLSGN
jgi:CheY-like chemotaxis protein